MGFEVGRTLGLVLEVQVPGVIKTASDIAHVGDAGLIKSVAAKESGETPGDVEKATIGALRAHSPVEVVFESKRQQVKGCDLSNEPSSSAGI